MDNNSKNPEKADYLGSFCYIKVCFILLFFWGALHLDEKILKSSSA